MVDWVGEGDEIILRYFEFEIFVEYRYRYRYGNCVVGCIF